MTSQESSIQRWRYLAKSKVTAVAISNDGKTIVAGTLDKRVLCLNEMGQLLWEHKLKKQVWRIGISADGETIVAGTGSLLLPFARRGCGLCCLTKDGRLRWREKLDATIWGLALSADGTTIAAGTDGNQLLLYNSQQQRLWQQDVRRWGWSGWVWSAALSQDGQIVAAGAADKHVRLLRRSGTLLAQLPVEDEVFTVAVSSNGQSIAAGDNSGYIYWLDMRGSLLWKEKLNDSIWSVALSPDGQRLIVGTGKKDAHLRTYSKEGNLLWRRYVEGSVYQVALNGDGRRMVVGLYEGGISIFGDEGNPLIEVPTKKMVRSVGISAAGEIVVAGSEDGYIYGFHLPPLPPVTARQQKQPPQTTGTVYHVYITDSKQIAIGDRASVRVNVD